MEDYYVRAGRQSESLGEAQLDQGRLAGIFCRLHRERFDGLMHVTSGASSASIGFRAGAPVTFVDPTQGHTLGEALMERGLLTRVQYSTVISRVTDGLVEDEAVAFCEHAIQLGYLSEEEADSELSQRIRSRLIQLMSWTECEVAFEPGEAALFGLRESPQNPGAIVYMGVRTFYDEDYLEQHFPTAARTYLRLLAAPASISHFYGLDDDEFRLLRRFSPEVPLSKLLSAADVERAHLLGLVMLLCVGEFCELSSTPFTSIEREISGARPAPKRAETQPAPQRAETQRVNPPDALTQRPSPPTPTLVPAKPESIAAPAKPQPASPSPAPASVHMAPPTPAPVQQPAVDATREALLEAAARAAKSRKASSPRRMPVDPATTSGSSAIHPAVRGQSGTIPSPLHQAHATQPGNGGNAATASARSAATATNARASSTSSSTHVAASGGHAQPRSPSTTQQPRVSAGTGEQARADYAKAHLEELIARRKQTAQPAEAAAARPEVRDLRHARELLRDQQWVRAEELLRTLAQQEPNNATLRAYHLWSRLRAHPHVDATLVDELQELTKKMVQDPEHVGFACYVLGHIHFSAKRDDMAERFFKRAHAADPGNKDAERHLLIVERRRQLAAEADAAANRKLFGIQISNGKPKS